MNEKALTTLEFHKVLSRLAEHAYSDAAKARCISLRPMTDKAALDICQEQVADALTRIIKNGSLSFSGVSDIGGLLKRLAVGGTLGTAELLSVASLLTAATRAKSYDRENDCAASNRANHASLSAYFSRVEPLTPLREEILRCILSEDEIADDASDTLFAIRRSLRGMNDRIRAQMNSMTSDANMREYLQDSVVTMRDGRYCLPVKAEAKSQVQGMVHDQSASGSTLFIEPLAVVNLNNEYRELLLKEQAEIAVILARLSSRAADFLPQLETDMSVLTELDFIFAKAAYALEYDGVAPIFNDEGRIHIRAGRHPLLDAKKAVPIDVRLGDDFSLLIVTGPNTGGKTVSLKTTGLLTLMGQSGLHIPAAERSELAIFDEVFADIGDEQSIEQSLSTFSSHMTNIIRILDAADSRSLVLLDELCAGTDPTEGAVLAVSILSALHDAGAKVMATTHYSELKVFALSTPDVENACCEFDVETLSPTYRLLIGIPGKSNAFAISEKLGLSPGIIEDARGRMTESEENFEDLLADLEKSRATIERDQLELDQVKAEADDLKRQLEQKRDRLDESRDKVLREANEQACQILREAKEAADAAIRNLNKYGQTNAPVQELEKERAKLRGKMDAASQKISAGQSAATSQHKPPKNLRIGDYVKVVCLNLICTVLSLPNEKGELYVQMGILNSLVNVNDLILLDDDGLPVTDDSAGRNRSGKPNAGNATGTASNRGGKQGASETASNRGGQKYAGGKTSSRGRYGNSADSASRHGTGTGSIGMSKSASISPEINLIGKTTDEAIPLLDKYLDDAYLAHLSPVRVVHGKGTGALRNAVQAHLKRQKYVKSFRLGEFGEGDSGVTIVEFTE